MATSRSPPAEPRSERPVDAVHDRRAWSSSSRTSSRESPPPGPAGHDRPAVRSHRRHRRDRHDVAPRARSSRCSGTSASATTSRTWRSPTPGSFSPSTLGLDPERLWVTVHVSRRRGRGDLARRSPAFSPGVCSASTRTISGRWARPGRAGRARRSSSTGEPSSGPAAGPRQGGERYVEIWNLVFMQYDRQADGSLTRRCPSTNIDTGAGLDRMLTQIQGVESVVRHRPRGADPRGCLGCHGPASTASTEETDVGLRIVADHARTFTFLISDGVFPVERGPRLRAAAPHPPGGARRRSASVAEGLVTPGLDRRRDRGHGRRLPEARVATATRSSASLVHEEEAFLRTLRRARPSSRRSSRRVPAIPGDVAFRLHDTFGFPIELTEEIAGERGVAVDRDGFDAAMAEQRRCAPGRQAATDGLRRAGGVGRGVSEIRSEFGPTRVPRLRGAPGRRHVCSPSCERGRPAVREHRR